MVIRWLGCYGSFRNTSLQFEFFENKKEISAEWTTGDRPFVLPDEKRHTGGISVGLIVKTTAVIRRFRYDSMTDWPNEFHSNNPIRWRARVKRLTKQNFKPEMLTYKGWEAICAPRQFVGIVILKNRIKEQIEQVVHQFAHEHSVPLFILQTGKYSEGGVTAGSIKRADCGIHYPGSSAIGAKKP